MKDDSFSPSADPGPLLKWASFAFMALALISVSVFWKIEKSRLEPLKAADKSANKPAGHPGGEAPMQGKMAPDFTLPALGGETLRLADYKGKLVFLNIWATWCAPCREEMPSMQRLAEKLAGGNFAMITISIDEKTEDVEKFVKELGLTFPVGMDPAQEVAAQYKITGVPETYIISPDGVVNHHLIGPGDWDEPAIVRAFSGQVLGEGSAGN
ncbi:MAG: TlpA family protein disulfide reductase [Nitrospinota bacterium]|nr:TlpA family protein disulfide reductase [Nitrospinota bacterium]